MIIIRFSLEDVSLFLAGDTPEFPELAGVFHVYSSADLGPMTDANGNTLEQGLVIEEPFNGEQYTLKLPEASEIRSSSVLVVSLFARSMESNKDYLVFCGSCSFYITNLMGSKKRHPGRLIDPHPSDPVEKGHFVLSLRSTTWKANVRKEPWMCGPDQGNRMIGYICRSAATYMPYNEFEEPANYNKARKYKPSHPQLSRIHCPKYQMEIQERCLPGFAYSWIKPRAPPREDFFVGLVQSALTLYEIDEKAFLTAIDDQFTTKEDVLTAFNEALVVVSGACTIYAQGQLYVSDHANKHRDQVKFTESKDVVWDENMGTVRVTHGDDCEGLGQDAMIVASTLRDYEQWQHPLTKACQRVLRLYTLLLTQAATTSASASQSTNEDEGFIAHIFGLMVPNATFCTMLRNTGSDPALVGVSDADLPAWTKDLDVLFCEGTSWVNPIQRPPWEWSGKAYRECIDMALDQRQFEEQNRAFSSYEIVSVPLNPHHKDPINFNYFYKYIVAAYVLRTDTGRVGDITFVYPKEATYGVLVYDLVCKTAELGLAINELLEPEEKQYIDDALNAVHPVPQPTPRNADLVAQDIAFLEKTLGLTKWHPSITNDNEYPTEHFGYFFHMEDLRINKGMLQTRYQDAKYYKYFGLDDYTAYIQLCVYPSTSLYSNT